jgi:superfamily II DNA or RNA helicase
MLPRQPLRFLLADDPGAGKTVMAGLLIKELLIRGDLERCLIIAPGSLVDQWQDELSEKFDLGFDILTRDQIEGSRSGNPFTEHDRMIMRLDMASRSDDLKAKLEAAPEWDLVICDEAHRMSASLFGNEVKFTKRYQLGQLIGTRTRHLLLMSATPHNGKDADFQLFMALLDADRFEGRNREGGRKADASDMMRRLTKEELRKFDGSPLFPERRAYTVQYALSPLEAELYAGVTRYVREEMNRADRLADDGRHRNSIGFALQI